MTFNRQDLFPAAHSLALLGLIAANVAVAIWFPVVCWVTIVPAAMAMAGALSVVHETSHATYFSGRWSNRIVGRFWALLILMNFSLYRRDHMLHHAHFGTDLDTEEQKHLGSIRDLAVALLINDHAFEHWCRSLRAAFGAERIRTIAYDAWMLIGVWALAAAATAIWPFFMALAFWLPFGISLILDNAVSLPEHAVFGDAEPETLITRTMQPSRPVDFLLYYVNLHKDHHDDGTTSGREMRRANKDRSKVLHSGYFRFYSMAVQQISGPTGHLRD